MNNKINNMIKKTKKKKKYNKIVLKYSINNKN